MAFQHLRLSALKESPTAFGSSYEAEAVYTADQIQARLALNPSRFIFGAFSNESMVGQVVLVREVAAKTAHKAMVYGMYVMPENRTQGIGKALLRELFNTAKLMNGVTQLNLSVNAENLGACRLYESLGFVEFGHESNALFVDGRYYDEKHLTKLIV